MDTRDSRGAEPLLAWPGMASLRLTLPLSYLFSKIFFTIYGLASLLAGMRGAPSAFYFDWELSLPFVPSVALIYLSVPLALVLTPFVLRTWRNFLPFFVTLTAETVIAGLIFLVAPVTQGYPQRVASGNWAWLFELADKLNLSYNEVPSLHVAFAVTVALVFGRRCGPLGKALFWLWAAAVVASALLMHEHHVLDVAAGTALGFVAVGVVHRRAAREKTLEGLRIEGLCLREFAHFARRHPRYLLIAAALFRETRTLRAAYCLAQHVDDVLDGDRKIKGDPEAYVRTVLRGLRGEAPFGDSVAEQLAAYVSGEMARFETERDDPRGDFVNLFEVLREDRLRMDARRALPAAELAELHRKTFFYSFNLTFILSGAKARAAEEPELIGALSWVSPVRDLAKDMKKGLINVPVEALEGGTVREWLWAEHERGAACIAALGAKVAATEDPRSRKILAVFHKALSAYERKYRKKERIEERRP
jgi:membrane-associated phospholipid phosphatase